MDVAAEQAGSVSGEDASAFAEDYDPMNLCDELIEH